MNTNYKKLKIKKVVIYMSMYNVNLFGKWKFVKNKEKLKFYALNMPNYKKKKTKK